jgi:hypothetical protein
MDASLGSLINLYTFSSGRRLFALQQTQKAARSANWRALVDRIEGAIQHDRQTRQLEDAWARAPVGTTTHPAVPPLDTQLDRVLTAIRDAAQAHAQGAGPGEPIIETVAAFLLDLFPKGLAAVTGARYVEELGFAEEILAKLSPHGSQAHHAQELGLGRLVTRLGQLVPLYRQALEATPEAGPSFGDVRAARQTGQQNLLEIVAMVLGRYPGADAESSAHRLQLLGPILRQNAEIARYRKSHHTIPDVNPETGDPTPEMGPPAADTPASAPAAGVSGGGSGGPTP